MKKAENILKRVSEKIEPSEQDMKLIQNSAKEFSEILKKNIKKLKINAEVFIGGSFAKKTVIKKDKYDVDIFIRYDKKYMDKEISPLTRKILNERNFSVVHGSRDYFRINEGEDFFIEIIPVKKVNKPEESENITDLSYSHVKYINKKIKNPKIINEIKIAKAFCYANGCYGAESYVQGFSGYSLELLVYYYGGFFKFIKAMSKIKKEKEIIDIEKHFKNKKNVLLDLNSSKLNSPVILIDPTYMQRNALAALSKETFEKFQEACRNFIKNPSINAFEIYKIDIEKVKEKAKRAKREFILLKVKTNRQEGDIGGSKLLKFYNFLGKEIEFLFNVKDKGFEYNNKQSAEYFFVSERKKEIIFGGPFVDDEENVINFKKEHKNVFEKGKRLYAKEIPRLSLKEFIGKWKIKNSRIIKEMYIDEVKNII